MVSYFTSEALEAHWGETTCLTLHSVCGFKLCSFPLILSDVKDLTMWFYIKINRLESLDMNKKQKYKMFLTTDLIKSPK